MTSSIDITGWPPGKVARYLENAEAIMANLRAKVADLEAQAKRADEQAAFWHDSYMEALDDISELAHSDDEPTRASAEALLNKWSEAIAHDPGPTT